MYIEPKTEVVPICTTNCLCGSVVLSVNKNATPDDFQHANIGR